MSQANEELTSGQRKFLRSKAHHLDPVVMVGKRGLAEEVIVSADEALTANELIKVRFQEFKDQKKELTAELAEKTNSHIAGIIGHIAILYRKHEEEEKREYKLPPA